MLRDADRRRGGSALVMNERRRSFFVRLWRERLEGAVGGIVVVILILICLTIVVYSLNMFGDAVRDLLDPRLRGGQGSYGGR